MAVGGSQMGAFLVKKGDYLCDLAVNHSKSSEFEKARDLYLQAAGWYKKAGATDKMTEAMKKAKAEDEKAKNAPPKE
nr:hypothetical protein [Candidatus Sigynarchaeota archaeon]